jgi:PAS domain S-box-containing protein
LEELSAQLEDARRDRQRLSSLFYCAPVAYVVTDPCGRIREANHEAARLLDRNAAAIVGAPIAALVAMEHRPTARRVIGTAGLEPPITECDLTLRRRGGETFPARVSVSSGPSADGGRELRWVIRDVTEWRRLDTELQTERARRERAEQADRAKEDFLAALSHELRTPATVAAGYLHLLRHGELDEEGRTRAFECMERSHSAHMKLVNDILDAARIGAGKLVIEASRRDLVALVRETIQMLQPSAMEKGLTVSFHSDSQQAWIDGDAERLQQVLWNLLSNALKFTGSGGQVQVRLRRTPHDVLVSVADNGAGIDPREMPYIFERFRQGGASLASRRRGLGLGLAIARSIVELHGGQLQGESPGRNQGATFSFSLPLASDRGV